MLQSFDSDVDDEFTIPESNIQGFDTKIDFYGLNVYKSDGEALHTWCLATANSMCKKASTGEAQKSLCPRGWKLPNKSDFELLTDNYNFDIAQLSPANFGFQGFMKYSNLESRSTFGGWWSSTAYSNTYSWRLRIDSTQKIFSVDNMTNNAPWIGYSVRCITRN